MDQALRKLERRFQETGSVKDEAEWLRKKERAGLIKPWLMQHECAPDARHTSTEYKCTLCRDTGYVETPPRNRLMLAAYLGHPAAREMLGWFGISGNKGGTVSGTVSPTGNVDSFGHWLRGLNNLQRWGLDREFWVDGAIAAGWAAWQICYGSCSCALMCWPTGMFCNPCEARHVLEAAEVWIKDPNPYLAEKVNNAQRFAPAAKWLPYVWDRLSLQTSDVHGSIRAAVLVAGDSIRVAVQTTWLQRVLP